MEQLLQLNKPITFYPIKNFPDYFISKTGLVFSKKTKKFLAIYEDASGYLAVSIRSKNPVMHHQHIHRLLAETFIPNPNNLPEVNHIDGNKANCALENLEWVSGSNNVRHAFTTGLQDRKASCNYSLLDEYAERLLNEPGLNFSSLARELKVSDASTIRKLLKREYERKGLEKEWEELCRIVAKKGLRSKKVRIYSLTGEEHFFDSQQEAAYFLGVSRPNVCKVLKSGKNRQISGYYIENVETK